jgi:sulfur relay (sulfurtransferase) DsrC/TusE family protein
VTAELHLNGTEPSTAAKHSAREQIIKLSHKLWANFQTFPCLRMPPKETTGDDSSDAGEIEWIFNALDSESATQDSSRKDLSKY